jgi:hypothetical protein
LIFGIIFKQNKKSILYFLALILNVFVISFIAIKFFPDIINNISKYLNQQFFPALKGEREITTDNRLKIIFDLLIDLSGIFALYILLLMTRIKSNLNKNADYNKNFLLFLIIGISASFPLMISLKQSKYYLIPSMPFYALSFGYLLYNSLMEKLTKISEIKIKWFNKLLYLALGLLVIFSISNFGKYSRDMEKIKDVNLVSSSLKEGTVISCSKEMCTDWSLVAYFSRIGYISLDCNHEHSYFLIKNGDEMPPNYGHIELKGNEYTLLKKSTETKNQFSQ